MKPLFLVVRSELIAVLDATRSMIILIDTIDICRTDIKTNSNFQNTFPIWIIEQPTCDIIRNGKIRDNKTVCWIEKQV